jgi:hypothetical protein
MRPWGWVRIVSLCVGLLWIHPSHAALIAHWPLNESGAAVVAAEVVNARNGSLCEDVTCGVQGPTWVNGHFGNGLLFDGNNDNVRVTANAAFNLTGDITIAAWIKRSTTSIKHPILAKTDQSTFWDYDFMVCDAGVSGDCTGHGNQLAFYADGLTPFIVFSTVTLTDTANFHHVAFVRSGSTYTFYIDGVVSGTGSLPGAFQTQNVPVMLGTDNNLFHGILDDVYLYNHALSAGEIVALMGATAQLTFAWDAPTTGDPPTGYKLYWRIAPAPYTSFVDVGNVLTGTVTGLTASTLYYMSVVAYNAAGDGPFSQEVGNLAGPTTPTAPTFLRLGAMACREVLVRWNLSYDDMAVTEYRLRRNGAQIGTTAGTVRSYDDASVSPSTAYTYVVRAADALANESSDSNSLVLTTPACP